MAAKATPGAQAEQVLTLRKNARVIRAVLYGEGMLQKPDRYRKAIPASGSLPAPEETGEQLTL